MSSSEVVSIFVIAFHLSFSIWCFLTFPSDFAYSFTLGPLTYLSPSEFFLPDRLSIFIILNWLCSFPSWPTSVGLSLCMCVYKHMYWNPLVGSWGVYLGGKENQIFFMCEKKPEKNPGSKSLSVYYKIGGGIDSVSMGIKLVLDLLLVFLPLQHHRIQIPLHHHLGWCRRTFSVLDHS